MALNAYLIFLHIPKGTQNNSKSQNTTLQPLFLHYLRLTVNLPPRRGAVAKNPVLLSGILGRNEVMIFLFILFAPLGILLSASKRYK